MCTIRGSNIVFLTNIFQILRPNLLKLSVEMNMMKEQVSSLIVLVIFSLLYFDDIYTKLEFIK